MAFITQQPSKRLHDIIIAIYYPHSLFTCFFTTFVFSWISTIIIGMAGLYWDKALYISYRDIYTGGAVSFEKGAFAWDYSFDERKR